MPTLTTEQFFSRLARAEAVPGILLLGRDVYLRDLCRAKLIEAYVPEGARDWGVTRFSAADARLDRILQQAETMPMLAPRQVVFVEETDALEKLGDDAREQAERLLDSYLQDPAPFTVLVFEAAQLDQRMKLFKMLSSRALVVSVELGEGKNEDDRLRSTIAQAAQMVPGMARDSGVEIEPAAAEELADILNGELARIRVELEKLATYAGSRKRITTADVDALVISAKKYSVWQLAEMLASRQRNRALEFLDSLLREGEEPVSLIGALAWMYRKLIEAQEAPAHLSGWQAARQLGMRPETAELALKQARRIPRQKLLSGLAALSEADSELKSSNPNPRALMEFLVARLTA